MAVVANFNAAASSSVGLLSEILRSKDRKVSAHGRSGG